MIFEGSRQSPPAILEAELRLDAGAKSTTLAEAGASSDEDVMTSHYLAGWRLYTLALGWVSCPSLPEIRLDTNDNEDLFGNLPC